jgi:hypothetical protein
LALLILHLAFRPLLASQAIIYLHLDGPSTVYGTMVC